jgi:hypothetical protein
VRCPQCWYMIFSMLTNPARQFHFSKHFFWFSEEPLSSEALTSYVRSEKTGVAQNAAWARETGKGVLFHTKRSEDKAHPAGLIPLVSFRLFLQGFEPNQFSRLRLPTSPRRAPLLSRSRSTARPTSSRLPPPPSATVGLSPSRSRSKSPRRSRTRSLARTRTKTTSRSSVSLIYPNDVALQ